MPVLNCFKVISSIVLSARMRLLLRSALGIGAPSIDTKERREDRGTNANVTQLTPRRERPAGPEPSPSKNAGKKSPRPSRRRLFSFFCLLFVRDIFLVAVHDTLK